ncbi:MAG: hypothetical protein KDA65_09995 [Planctomycetaceae bacterium]|nr:hypothetical protein [Planctomycetaceae bacterium]
MQTFFKSKPVRRIIIGTALILLFLVGLFGWVQWDDYRRAQVIEEFTQNTTLEKNPWGIKAGMTFPELQEKMPPDTFKFFLLKIISPSIITIWRSRG